MNPNDLVPKGSNIFICEKCDYTSSRKSQYDRHLVTAKHLNPNKILNKLVEKVPIIPSFDCVCGKIYKHQSSLCNHTKICTEKIKFNDTSQMISNNPNNNNNFIIEILKQNNTILLENQEFKELFLEQNNDFKELILEKPQPNENNDSLVMELLKQNQEFKELMIEQNKYMMEQMIALAKNTGNNNNNTTNNTKFNMQFFLNETCKNAMSITEFVDSLELTFEDLENVGRVGYAEGISQIFIKGIRATEICKRPIHCSDIKRVVMFINDINGWEKDSNSNEKIIRLIKQIAKKNMKQSSVWISQHQHIVHGHGSREQKQYSTMIGECFGGGTEEEDTKNYNKIIKRIAPEIYIDKYKN